MTSNPFAVFTGPLLVGALLNSVLFGVLALQVYVYSRSYPHDSVWLKAVVGTLFVLDIVQSVLSSHYVWTVLIDQWSTGGLEALQSLSWSSTSIPIIGGLLSIIAQLFFVWRIHALRSSVVLIHIICVLIAMLALMQGLAAIVGGFLFAAARTVTTIKREEACVRVWLIGSFICDVLIAVTMFIVLDQARRASPWKKTATLVNALIIRVVETGAVTAITAGIELALYKFSSNSIYIAPAFILGKLYSNAVLANLNVRQSQGQHSGLGQSTSLALQSGENHELSLHSHPRDTIGGRTAILVHTTVEDDAETGNPTKAGSFKV